MNFLGGLGGLGDLDGEDLGDLGVCGGDRFTENIPPRLARLARLARLVRLSIDWLMYAYAYCKYKIWCIHCIPVRGMCTSLMNALIIFLCALSSHSMFLYNSLHMF